jgi:hypothetical protein
MPPNGSLLADEPFYVLMRYKPAEGMEHADSHKLDLPAAQAASLHVVPGKQLDRRVKAQEFDTVVVCDDDDRIDALGLPGLYKQKADIFDCTIFWDRTRK